VAAEVCEIENTSNRTLKATALPKGFVRVNGTQVAEDEEGSVNVFNGDRLTIGRAHIFRAVIPWGRRKTEDMLGEQKFEAAMRELQENANIDPKWRRGVDDAVIIVKRDHGTKQANDLLAQAKAASETVAHANALLKEVPADWGDGVSHYELAVMFEADGLPVVCVVARASSMPDLGQGSPEQDPGEGGRPSRLPTKGIWEAARFKVERLPYMEQAIEEIQSLRLDQRMEDAHKLETMTANESFLGTVNSELLPSRKMQLRAPTLDDWQSYAWSEVLLARYNQLLNDHLEVKEDLAAAEDEAEKEKQKDDQPWFLSWLEPRRGKGPEPNQQKAPQEEQLGFWGGLAANLGLRGSTPALPPPSSSRPTPDEPQMSRSSSRVARKARDKGKLDPGENGTLLVPKPSQARARSRSFAGLQTSSSSIMDPASGAKDGSSGHKVHVRRASNSGHTSSRGSAVSSQAGSSTSWPAADKEDTLSNKIVVPLPKGQSVRKGTSELAQLENVLITVPQLFEGKLGVRLRMENLVVTGFDVQKAADLGWRVGDEIIAVKGRPVRSKEDFRRELAHARNELPITFTVVRARAHGHGEGDGYPGSARVHGRHSHAEGTRAPPRRQPVEAGGRQSVMTAPSAEAVLGASFGVAGRPMDTE